MLKNKLFILPVALFLFSGCAERGYIVTTTPSTHTATAQMSSDIRETKKSTKENLSKMKSAVKKALRKKRLKQERVQKKRKEIARKKAKERKVLEELKAQKLKEDKLIAEQKRIEDETKALAEKKLKEEKKALAEKKAKEAKLQAIQAEKEKNLAVLKAKKKAKEAKALQEKMALEKQAQETAKLKEAETAKKQKLLEDKKSKEAALVKEKRLAEIKAQEKKLQAQKALKEKKLQEIKRKQEPVPTVKSHIGFTQPLKFRPINKIYQKFGTSEIHGHVIYLDSMGQEVNLGQSKVYLLPVSAKLNNWYDKYYLHNKSNHLSSTAVNYLNDTTLNLDKNFNFFGVPAGNYYIVIESLYPGTLKKVYIAKKINVGKYKKVMAVFSKKL